MEAKVTFSFEEKTLGKFLQRKKTRENTRERHSFVKIHSTCEWKDIFAFVVHDVALGRKKKFKGSHSRVTQ